MKEKASSEAHFCMLSLSFCSAFLINSVRHSVLLLDLLWQNWNNRTRTEARKQVDYLPLRTLT
jgi:hypothetical protein